MDKPHRIWVIALSFLAAFMLTAMPLPEWALPWRPAWIAMVLVYWCMALPERVGVITGWVSAQDIEEFLQGGFECSAGIDIGRRAELFGDGGQGDGLGVQDAILNRKLAHWVLDFWSVLTSLEAGAVLVSGILAGAGFGLPNKGAGGGPGGISSGPFMPQAARPRVSRAARIRVINDGSVSKLGMLAYDG